MSVAGSGMGFGPRARLVTGAVPRANVLNTPAASVVEEPGRGVEGDVEGSRVAVGARSFILASSVNTLIATR